MHISYITELLLLNIPLLAIRSYISVRYADSISVFLVKNIVAILYGAIEIYDCCYEIKLEKKEKETACDDQDMSNINGMDNKSLEPETKKEITIWKSTNRFT